jgi:dihydropteroate synthase
MVMGIVNVTPDSFSDGGLFINEGAAAAHGKRLVREGAAILDIGGESTRGGASPVSEDEEMRRVLPVITALRSEKALLSIDTMKAPVAEAALAAGAHIVNDVRGLQGDAGMAAAAANAGAGVVVMHNPGVFGSSRPIEGDAIAACVTFFKRSIEIALAAGVREDRIALDPGFGFGKSPDQNLELLARIDELGEIGFPILVGTSRKSFIGKLVGLEVSERLVGTIVTNVLAAFAGAAIVRVHDVREHVTAVRMTAAIRAAGSNTIRQSS